MAARGRSTSPAIKLSDEAIPRFSFQFLDTNIDENAEPERL